MAFAGTVGKYNQLQLRSSEYTGTSNDPVLEVTYTLPAPESVPTLITYAYDPQGQRIILANGAKTTYYPTKLYNTDRTTITKHLFANGSDIATIEGSGATAKVYYNHADLLNSSSVMTDSVGVIAETLDYFPFGGIRIDDKTSVFSEQRKYIGQEFDADTGLNYLNARYYNSNIGRFLSEDPMFWSLPKELLLDPQQLNSYAYARNNPIGLSDPSGLLSEKTAGIMSAQIYINGSEGNGLQNTDEKGWSFVGANYGGTSMKMGVYQRVTDTETQCVISEYALVFRGTRDFTTQPFGATLDWMNNILQPFGFSPDATSAQYKTRTFIHGHSNTETTTAGTSKGGAEAVDAARFNNVDAVVFNPAPLTYYNYSYNHEIKNVTVNGEILSSIFGVQRGLDIVNNNLPYTNFAKNYGSNLNPINAVQNFGSLVRSSVQNHFMTTVNKQLK